LRLKPCAGDTHGRRGIPGPVARAFRSDTLPREA
jgi:hypothetical protein